MKYFTPITRRVLLKVVAVAAALFSHSAGAQTNSSIRIVETRGEVEVLPHGASNWVLTKTNQVLEAMDRIRTGTNSSVAVLWTDQSVLRFDALAEMEILPPDSSAADHGLHLIDGILSFFHRDQPGRIRIITSGALAGIEGTELVMSVRPTHGLAETTLSVIDGKVTFANAAGSLQLTNHEQAVAEPNRAPRRTTGFIANNILQWCFYYPGVLDLRDLENSQDAKNILADSLAAYRAGDLPGALASFYNQNGGTGPEEIIFHAALLLNGGQIEAAEGMLTSLTATSKSEKNLRIANALRWLIAAVKHQTYASPFNPQLATEFLASSYYAQSQGGSKSLTTALELAQKSVAVSPEFGFGWERVAELEFSFGHTDRAREALERALKFSPRNAEALSLKGYLLAAQNQPRAALAEFDRALAADSALGNAWLGRGLCRIRNGDAKNGREDLLIAAAMEPQRAALRSYLGKAFGDASEPARAVHELNLARQLDTNDPTAWLYSGLLNEQNNQLNDAIRDLEKSQELNENRSIYRSGMLLDQDRAVRSANLARIYAEAGLGDYALREAGESVAENYGNFGAHLYLANAYQQNEPAGPFGRRYETSAFSEHLITALLGPVNASIIAPEISQQEYTQLFERDGAHVSSDTEYLSRGAWSQTAVQYGTFGPTSYALEGDYSFDPGQARNAQLEFHSFSATIKQMVTPKDSIFLQVDESSWQGGDTSQHYYPESTSPTYNFKEEQLPNILLGYHHEWSPDSHTLFLASRFYDQASYFGPNSAALILLANNFTQPPFAAAATDLTRYFNRTYTANTFELQQVQKAGDHTVIAGARAQINDESIFDSDSAQANNLTGGQFAAFFINTPYTFPPQNLDVPNGRASLYLSDYWQIDEHWLVYGGLDADYLSLARNTIAPPVSSAHNISHPISPKAGVLWKPTQKLDFSLAYAESVTGEDLDQSVRLEPTEFAGLPLTFRTAFPDSLVGGPSGEHIAVWQAGSRWHLDKDTYAVLGYQHLQSKLSREIGSYTSTTDQPQPTTSREDLNYQEDSFLFSFRHLFHERFSSGLQYEVAHARLNQSYNLPLTIFDGRSNGSLFYNGILNTFTLDSVANLPSGIFAGASATWRSQTDLTDTSLGGSLPTSSFWQLDLFAGYRSPLRHFELKLGLLNLTGSNYRLDPINQYPDLPRRQTLSVSMRLNF